MGALHNSFEILSLYYRRPTPATPINVSICHTEDILPGANGSFTYLDASDLPRICLPCGNGRAPTQLDLDDAEAVVLHELTHVFNWAGHSPRLPESQPWLWLDEALAILIEHKFGQTPHLGRRTQGNHHPYPLDDPHAGELAALFLSFLEVDTSDGLESIFRSWDTDRESRHPVQMLGEDTFLSSFHRFAKSIYFHRDAFHHSLAYVRDSLTAEAIELTAAVRHRTRDATLDHLSFVAYDVHIQPDIANSLEVRLVSARGTSERLMASVIPVCVGQDLSMQAGREYRLFGDDSDQMEGLEVPVRDSGGEPVLRVIVVISNCGTRGDEHVVLDDTSASRIHLEHDDSMDFELRLALI